MEKAELKRELARIRKNTQLHEEIMVEVEKEGLTYDEVVELIINKYISAERTKK